MPAKVRVTATQGRPGNGSAPPPVYRAEAYEEQDQFREPVWNCTHDHDSVEAALRCGEEWLRRHRGRLAETA